jgi:hypothetical protein
MNLKIEKSWLRGITLGLIIVGATFMSGCASHYIPPSGRADFATMTGSAATGSTMQESFAAKPAAGFPAGLAVARVQDSHYRNYHIDQTGGVYGSGKYSVVTVKELGEETALDTIAQLPQIGGITSISTMLLPAKLESDRDLREAAARLKADMLLLYTFETSFHDSDKALPLSVITLGLSPTHQVAVHVTASALLLDTRTGFIYATLEANEQRKVTTSAWLSEESADRARLDAEQTAFKALVEEFKKSWPRVVERAKQGA